MSTEISLEDVTIAVVSVTTTTDPERIERHQESLENQRALADEHFWLSPDDSIADVCENAKSRYLVLVPTDAELTRTAIEMIKFDIQLYGPASLIFGDEYHTSDDLPPQPVFRPDFSPLTATEQEPIGRIPILRRLDIPRTADGYQPGTEASPIALNCYDQGLGIRQLPSILARFPDSSPPKHQPDANNIRPGALSHGETQDLISIIIPTAGFPSKQSARPAVLDLMDSLRTTVDTQIEVIIVCDEGFDAELISAIRERLPIDPRFVKHRRDADHFNFARMINQGALSAKGQILVFLNDDITDLSTGWLSTIRQHFTSPDSGALGAWITEPNGNLWHFGITTQPADGGLPIHAGIDSLPGYEPKFPEETRHCLAVTGALLAIPRQGYWHVGGLASRFPSDYNDVDLCLKLNATGLVHTVSAGIHVSHEHGTSRGRTRNIAAEDALQKRWIAQLASDPWRNPNVAHETLQPMADWQHWDRQPGIAVSGDFAPEFNGSQAGDGSVPPTALGYEVWPSIRSAHIVQPRRCSHP